MSKRTKARKSGKLGKMLVGLIVLIVVAVVCVGGFSKCSTNPDVEEPPTTETPVGDNQGGAVVGNYYNIIYRAVLSGEVTTIPENMFKENGRYPTTYLSGAGATIDDLEEIVYISSNEDRMFLGWYLDEACTQSFDGTISKETTGGITLYAKISAGFWTKNY